MSKFAVLNKDFALKGWSDDTKRIQQVSTGVLAPVIAKVFYILSSCDGKTDFNSPLFMPYHLEILETLEKQGIVNICDTESSIYDYQKYHKADCQIVTNVHWAVTGNCNLKCKHCYICAPEYKYKEPSFKQIENVVKGFVEANVPAVTITGGEPFMRADLFDIVDLLYENHIPVRHFYTNTLLLNESIMKKVEKLPLKPEFHVSFDGMGSHDYMRGVNGIEVETISRIRMLRDAGYTVAVSTSVDRNSAGRLLDTYDLMKDLGISVWRVMTPYETGDWQGKGSLSLTLAEELEHYAPVFQQWKEDGHPMVIQLGNLFDGRRESIEGYKPLVHQKFLSESKACDTCAYSTYLEPEGKLLPCLAYTGTSMADSMPNVYEMGFVEAYKDMNLRNVCDMKRRDLFGRNSECATCEHFEKCGVGCRAVAYQQTDDIYAKDCGMCDVFTKGFKEELLHKRSPLCQ